MADAPVRVIGRKKRWHFALVLVVLLVGVTEVGARLVFRVTDGRAFSYSRLQRERKKQLGYCPVADDETTKATRAIFMLHPYLGMVLNPEHPGPLPGFDRINEYGFCGAPPAVHKRAPDKLIIAILGGSVASMLTAQTATILEKQLQAAPRYAGKKIILVNLAIPGHKQPQQILALNYALALGNEFDLIINLDGFNEVALYPHDGLAQGAHPLFPYRYALVAAQAPDLTSRRLEGQFAYLQEKRAGLADTFSRGPLRLSVTANLLWRARDRMLSSELARCERALASHKPVSRPIFSIGPQSDKLDDEGAMLEELVAIWKRGSLQLQGTCQGHGSRYYHFLQPNQYVPGSKELTSAEKKVAWNEEWKARPWIAKGYPRLRAAGKELAAKGVKFTDLSMVYVGHDKHYYVDPCCHVNTDGNKVLAEAIVQSLLETDEPPR